MRFKWRRGYDDGMAGRPMPEIAIVQYWDGYDAGKAKLSENSAPSKRHVFGRYQGDIEIALSSIMYQVTNGQRVERDRATVVFGRLSSAAAVQYRDHHCRVHHDHRNNQFLWRQSAVEIRSAAALRPVYTEVVHAFIWSDHQSQPPMFDLLLGIDSSRNEVPSSSQKMNAQGNPSHLGYLPDLQSTTVNADGSIGQL
jgi:hypothetical protein